MKTLLIGLILGFLLGFGVHTFEERLHTEIMTIVDVRYNENSMFGYNHGFWEYWANNSKTGNSYQSVSFTRVVVGQRVRVKR